MSFDINVKVDVRIPDLQSLAAALTCLAGHSSCKCGEPPEPSVPVEPEPSVESEHPAPQVESPKPAATEEGPKFTLDEVCKVAADFLSQNSDKMPQLLDMLQKYGVPAMTELKPDQLNGVASDLRAMGAQI